MPFTTKIYLLILVSLAVIASCSPSDTRPKNLSSCHIIYDAGSSGTRLYIYEKRDNNWLEHQGPKVSALADPVREIRDKTQQDIDTVTTEIVDALEAIKDNGPADNTGKPKWPAFDWQSQCRVDSAKVYATAGMRLAEHENREASAALWQSLKQKLTAKLGAAIDIDTRTISGYEEGLYTWLTVRSSKSDNNFGIAEMGGASAQITFPCASCSPWDNVRTVMVKGNPVKIYSYSFLGLGTDEAPKTLGMPPTCAYGAGTIFPDWEPPQCAERIAIATPLGVRDPYNYDNGKRGTYNRVPTHLADIKKWYLTGAFNYLHYNNIYECCATQGKCYNQDTSCFRTLYSAKYLYELNISPESQKADVSWTRGAMICGVDDCLRDAKPLECRWSDQGCL